jgi:hypothetical protein
MALKLNILDLNSEMKINKKIGRYYLYCTAAIRKDRY